MKVIVMNRFPSAVATLSWLLAGMVSTSVSAATYVVDSSVSSVQFGFVYVNTALTPQFAGANVAFFGGTVEASVPLGGGLLTLDSTAGFGDSLIVALPNPAGPFSPAVGDPVPVGEDEIFGDGTEDPLDNGDGVFTVGDDIYGLDLFNAAFVAVRDFALTAEGAGNTGGPATGIGWNIAAGWTAINAFGSYSENAAAEDASNPETYNSGGVIGYSLVGTTETITIPVDINVVNGDSALIFTGQIVASRAIAIPEPVVGLWLAGLAVAGMGVRRRRRWTT